MSITQTFDQNGEEVGSTVSTNTVTVFFGRKMGRENYGNEEASLFLQIDVTDDDTLDTIQEKIKGTYTFAKTLVYEQLGVETTVEDGVVRDVAKAEKPKASYGGARKSAAPKATSNGSADKDALWQSYVDDPNKWWDNRDGKRNPKAPDFKHKDTGDGLWLDKAPSFVKEALGV